jgi:hypothetical protein
MGNGKSQRLLVRKPEGKIRLGKSKMRRMGREMRKVERQVTEIVGGET